MPDVLAALHSAPLDRLACSCAISFVIFQQIHAETAADIPPILRIPMPTSATRSARPRRMVTKNEPENHPQRIPT